MSEARVYLDTSAYLAVLLGETEGERFRKLLKNTVVCSSPFLLIEAERNLIRMVRQKVLDESIYEQAYAQLQLDKEGLILKDFSTDLCLTRDFPAVKTPRAADLVHLRTALWFQKNGGLRTFISLDQSQLAAARELGLEV